MNQVSVGVKKSARHLKKAASKTVQTQTPPENPTVTLLKTSPIKRSQSDPGEYLNPEKKPRKIFSPLKMDIKADGDNDIVVNID